ncbi:MAG: SGNH/GDSL hydrolase family protein [Nocardioidaceae bacterium]
MGDNRWVAVVMVADQDDEDSGAYVALGDSISIDDYAGGPGRGGASLLAHNRDDDFPAWRGHDLGGRPFHLLATDGATSRTLLEQQVPRLERSGLHPSIVTLTIGGNDVLGWYGDTEAALRAADAAVATADRVLDQLRRLADPSVRIVLGTVYDPSDGTADASSVGLPPWPEVVEVLAHLNAALRRLAERHGIAIADIHAQFLGHGLATGNPGQVDPRPADRDLWYCDVIEPNAWGASAVREAFWSALGFPPPDEGAERSA